MESVVIGTWNLLEAIRFQPKPIRFYNAGSSECYGNLGDRADETTPFHPCSLYGIAKSARSGKWRITGSLSNARLLRILFNHESHCGRNGSLQRSLPRPQISNGSDEKLSLGNLAIQRDWGWPQNM
jgi:GDPmannose 4,6-dehydratase